MDWITPEMIGSVGFPVAVASYLLLRMEKVIGGLTDSVRQNTELVRLLIEKVGK